MAIQRGYWTWHRTMDIRFSFDFKCVIINYRINISLYIFWKPIISFNKHSGTISPWLTFEHGSPDREQDMGGPSKSKLPILKRSEDECFVSTNVLLILYGPIFPYWIETVSIQWMKMNSFEGFERYRHFDTKIVTVK